MRSDVKDLAEEFSFQLDEFYLDLQEDGNRISILNKEKIEERPFPGLRPFKTSEFQLFKGRDGQAEELIKRLKKNHFLAVIGSSGTGKSSLVRAGLIPQLFGGYLQEAGNKWNVAICRPGKDPVANLAIALSSINGCKKDRSNIYDNFVSIGPKIENSLYGILEVNEMLNSGKQEKEKPNLLIIIDQFEELFRFDRKELGKKNIENHFVNLLLKASLNINSSVYVIITMRSEFLGDCVKYRGLPEAINEGQYLVPQLSRNQVKDVIEAPIKLAGKKIDAGLIELLINEIEESKLKENLDQLPILQHALMRTYQEAMKEGPDTKICYEHYKRIGEMEKALAHHAESKFKELAIGGSQAHKSTKKQKIAKVIFQALTDASSDQKGGRRPTELKNIYAIAKSINASEEEVDEVINHFRDLDTSFIMPPLNPNLFNTGLYPDLMMDISHESLMRNWQRLTEWINEEVRFGKLYKSLNERRELNEQDKSELVRGVLLKELLEWKGRYSNNVTWARRYQQMPTGINNASLHENLYKKNIQFLEDSETANIAAKEAEEKKLKKEVESARKVIKIFIAATIISLSFGLFAFKQKNQADKQKKIAIYSETEARKQRDKAIVSESIARKQESLALSSKNDAQAQKEIAVQLKHLADDQSKSLAKQLNKSEKQIAKIELQKERFYSSGFLDSSSKESVVAFLLKEPLTEPEKIPLKKYIDLELLYDINSAIEAREKIVTEPMTGLRMADKVWTHLASMPSKHDKNKVVQKVLKNIFEKNIFYKQEIAPLPDNASLSAGTSSFKISRDASRFAFNYLNGIITGAYNNDSITIKKESIINLLKSGQPRGNSHNSEASIIALSYLDDKVISFQDDGRVIIWSDNGIPLQIFSFKGADNILIAEFSKNGKALMTVSTSGLSKIYDISELISGRDGGFTRVMDNNIQNRNIRKMIFSPDNKRLIRIFNNNRFDIWDIRNQRAALIRTFPYSAANFSSDNNGNYILASSAKNTIVVIDTAGIVVNYLSLSNLSDEKNNTASPINNLSLSADYKKLLVRRGSEILMYNIADEENPGSIPIDILTKASKIKLRSHKLSGSQDGIIKTAFLNNNTVISLSESGRIYLWNTRPVSNNLDSAFIGFKQIKALTFENRLESGQIDFRQVIVDTNKNNLREAALYYYSRSGRKNFIDTAILVFEKIRHLYPGSLCYDDLNKFASLLEVGISRIEHETPEQKNQNRFSILAKLKEIAAIRKEQSIMDSTDKTLIRKLANNYNDLAYYNLYAKQFSFAIKNALEGLRVDSSHAIIYTNLALAYLLSNQNKHAEEIYLEYKDKKIISLDNMSFREAFLQDFYDFTIAGVISPTDVRVKRIKEMLQKK
ncbi:MAG: hypothetical protein ABIN89_26425 [Chitinophagaceae bacterium]